MPLLDYTTPSATNDRNVTLSASLDSTRTEKVLVPSTIRYDEEAWLEVIGDLIKFWKLAFQQI